MPANQIRNYNLSLMQITELGISPRKKGFYRVAVDNRPVGYISAEDIFSLGIALGQEISREVYRRLISSVKTASFYQAALNYCARRLHSRSEVERYLYQRHCPEKLASEIISKLSVLGLIDDKRLAQALIHDAQLTRPLSKRALKGKLRTKNIDKGVIDETLEQYSYDEKAALKSVIDKKKNRSAYLNDPKKLTAYLIRQGFSYYEILEQLKIEEED